MESVSVRHSPSAFTDSAPPSPNSAYLKQWRRYASPVDAACVTADILFRQGAWSTEESINCLFPWKNYHVTLRPANIMNNLRNKTGQVDLKEAVNSIEERWRYFGSGHGASDYRLDLNWAAAVPFNEMIGNDLEKLDGRTVAPQRERTLREICDFCTEHGIQMMAVMLPMPTYNQLDEESAYTDIMAGIENILADYDVPTYDFGRLATSYFEPKPELFSDSTHLNVEGCRLFTDVFAQFFDDWMNGNDVDKYFVAPQEAAAATDYVSVLFAEGAATQDGIEVNCRAVAGPNVDIEFRLCRFVGQDIQAARWEDPLENVDDWQPVTDWSSDPSITWTPDASGTYELRAMARKVGSDVPLDRFRDVTVVY